ncbi:hypothetical protein HKCCE2091_00740 [Rhodobacterales bacterium HKCCE2091]|nr:hypothetical protein [Rhodobacterales bacterium HKCCE2091]
MADPEGFTMERRKDGSVAVSHHGRAAATLRGAQAAKLIALADRGDEAALQAALARVTGNYRRGNEKLAKGHKRNA